MFQANDLVCVSDLKKTFLKRDKAKWSYNLHKIKANINDTKPRYKIDTLQERYNDALLKETELTLNENRDVIEKLNIT